MVSNFSHKSIKKIKTEKLFSPGFFSKKFPIYFSQSSDFSDFFDLLPESQKKFVFVDSAIPRLFPDFIKKFKKNVVLLNKIVAIEHNKDFNFLETLFNKIHNLSPSRDDIIIIIGGGITLNLIGFVATLVMRGIKFIYVPTTLTAQIDVCVGGKLAVNFNNSKNWIGTFNDPQFCYINPKFLVTLNKKELLSELVEGIKLALVMDKKLFFEIFNSLNCFYEKRKKLLPSLVRKLLALKIRVIKIDIREEYIGLSLLYGHTIGHAIESLSDGKLNHGQSVALGMLCVARISKHLGFCTDEFITLHKEILFRLNLLDKIPKHISIDKILAKLKYDKKNYKGRTRFILLTDVGTIAIKRPKEYYYIIPKNILVKALEDCYI